MTTHLSLSTTLLSTTRAWSSSSRVRQHRGSADMMSSTEGNCTRGGQHQSAAQTHTVYSTALHRVQYISQKVHSNLTLSILQTSNENSTTSLVQRSALTYRIAPSCASEYNTVLSSAAQ